MSEVVAHNVGDYDHCVKPGDFYITPENEADFGCRRIYFMCPCGKCDGIAGLAGIRVRSDGTKENYCWAWNRDEQKPTCTPSINIANGHWHGYLTDGVFKSC
jgi:hypothetical protein